jgi:hypothetical protein
MCFVGKHACDILNRKAAAAKTSVSITIAAEKKVLRYGPVPGQPEVELDLTRV